MIKLIWNGMSISTVGCRYLILFVYIVLECIKSTTLSLIYNYPKYWELNTVIILNYYILSSGLLYQ